MRKKYNWNAENKLHWRQKFIGKGELLPKDVPEKSIEVWLKQKKIVPFSAIEETNQTIGGTMNQIKEKISNIINNKKEDEKNTAEDKEKK